ncbi:MAG: wax ester/triacylglycerol synthase family O-acyltransferase [Halieaceae bacterium]|jgi:diacylglycerol O-acyltransferase|nr:wax ester/triacylglycerol synthase family O-acyltransferase [Halieaceae bacterium]
MSRMPITDAMFLINETRRTPMHVGGLHLFDLPEGVDDIEFLSELGDILSYDGDLRHPFGERLKMGPLGQFGPISWEKDRQLDMDYHIRHSALPAPGRYRELFALVSRLHSSLLDRSRPLWELHLIEGLQNRQFAMYLKTHHCAIDGAGSMHLLNSMYSPNQKARIQYSPFSQEAYEAYKEALKQSRPRRVRPKESEMKAVLEAMREQLGGAVHIGKALKDYAAVWLGLNKKLAAPVYKSPRTPLSQRITGARRFVAQSWDFQRVRTMSKAFDGTLNDGVLAMVSGALRRYLVDQNALPRESLTAMAPISLRDADDTDSANAVAFITANLGTAEKDPAKRMRVIQESMQAGKQQLSGMSRREVEIYTALTQLPTILTFLTGSTDRFPAFSTVVSNVPGPRQQMYWNGARLAGLYPVSIPFDGFAANFTVVSHDKNLDFGIVACRHTLPQVQRMIDYMEESLVELEEAAGLRSKPVKRKLTPKKKPAAKKKPASRKAPAKKSAAKKAPTKKAAAKKRPAAKKKAPARKASSGSATARKKAAPRKAAPRNKAVPKAASRSS